MKFSNVSLSALVAYSQMGTLSAFAISGKSSKAFNRYHQASCRRSGIDGMKLNMASDSGGQRKRRKRKQPPPTSTQPLPVEDVPIDKALPIAENISEKSSGSTEPNIDAESNLFKFDATEAAALGITDAEDEDDIVPTFSEAMAPNKSNAPLPKFSDLANKPLSSPIGALELPDIRDAVKNKQSQQKAEEEEEDDTLLPKIKRSDIEGFKKLLEVEPNADSEQKFFENEEYGTVSALLGEGARPFLGIPPGPLQIGHFIGLLGISLCAFVVYPGFPLTNLPTPIRDALQGGLGSILLINLCLAGFSVFKSGERGQSQVLWAVKTLGVGGLAFDQLTQLPTLDEIEEMKSRKGKRAIKRR